MHVQRCREQPERCEQQERRYCGADHGGRARGKGCPEGWSCAAGGEWWGSALDWRGLVWCEPRQVGGHVEMLQALPCWAGGLRGCRGVVTSRAKRGGTGGDALRRSMHVGGSRNVGAAGGKGLR